jgi:hypothetical protein
MDKQYVFLSKQFRHIYIYIPTMSEQPETEPISIPDEPILKPKKPRKPLSDEIRQKRSEHMRRINEERIEKSRHKYEENLKKKEEEIQRIAQKKLESVSKKKEKIQKIKQEKGEETEAPKAPIEPPKSRKSRKQVIVELSSESESETDTSRSDEEEEIIYVAKKPTKKYNKKSARKDNGIVKPKHNHKIQSVNDYIPEAPKTIIKFI